MSDGAVPVPRFNLGQVVVRIVPGCPGISDPYGMLGKIAKVSVRDDYGTVRIEYGVAPWPDVTNSAPMIEEGFLRPLSDEEAARAKTIQTYRDIADANKRSAAELTRSLAIDVRLVER